MEVRGSVIRRRARAATHKKVEQQTGLEVPLEGPYERLVARRVRLEVCDYLLIWLCGKMCVLGIDKENGKIIKGARVLAVPYAWVPATVTDVVIPMWYLSASRGLP
jgi:hypothetical protein